MSIEKISSERIRSIDPVNESIPSHEEEEDIKSPDDDDKKEVGMIRIG